MSFLKTTMKRVTSGALAFIMAAGLIPTTAITAFAATDGMPDTVTYNTQLTDFDTRYTSDNLGSVLLRVFYVNANGSATPGWCADHDKPDLNSPGGYSNPQKIESNSVMMPMLDVYMDAYMRNKEIEAVVGTTDVATIKQWLTEGKGEEYGWGGETPWFWYQSQEELITTNAATQGAVWLYQSGVITESTPKEEKYKAVAEERNRALSARGYHSPLETDIQFVRQIYEAWESGTYQKYDYYLYSPNSNPDSTQNIIIPRIVQDYEGYIKLKKSGPDGQPLAGAVFGIYADESCSRQIGEITSAGNDWAYSPALNMQSRVQNFWVKEISPPPSTGDENYILNPKAFPVTVDGSKNNTQETAVAVNDGNPIKNTVLTDEGVIFKVDADGDPIGPATFRFVSLTNEIDRSIETDESGVIKLQWLDKTAEDYIAPGEYTVTEQVPPPGYAKSDESQNIKFWVEYDDEGLPLLKHSGPLTFKNDQLRKIKVLKVDASGDPLEGATFQIFKDGTPVGYETTGADGSFTWAGVDGQGLESGHYEFVETQAPSGYLIPANNRLETTIDISDPSLPEVIEVGPMVNYDTPVISIRKLINGTTTGLAGAVFQVKIDGVLIDETFTSDDEGWVTITYDKYGAYLDTSKDEWIVEVREVVAPDGYLIDDPEWHQLTMRKGETLKEFTFTDTAYPGIVIYKLDAETGDPLPGATFSVLIDGHGPLTGTTDEHGMWTIDYDEYGHFLDEENRTHTVVVTELKMPDGYNKDVQDESGDYTLTQTFQNGQTLAPFVFKDTSYRTLKVLKTDSEFGDPLKDAWFVLESVVLDEGGSYREVKRTGEDGYAVFEGVPNGTYHLWESKSPDGFEIVNDDVRTVIVTSDSPKEITFDYTNSEQKSIRVYKTDSADGEPIAGVRFAVYDSEGKLVTHIVTDSTGWASTGPLPSGTYTLIEDVTPDTHVKDETPHIVEVVAGQVSTIQIENAPKTALHIWKNDKTNSDKYLGGAVFEVKKTCGVEPCVIVGEYETDYNGLAVTEPLEPGIYIVTEKVAPAGYALDETEYEVCVKEGEVNEITISDQPLATLRVRKIDSKTGEPIPGAVFKLENADTSDLVGLQESDTSGDAIFTGLKEGFYIVTEEQAPDGYMLSDPNQQIVHVEYGKNNYVDFKNPEIGWLVVVLQDAHTSEYLPDGEFRVVRESDQVVVYDGRTDVTGTIVVGDLIPGWYTVYQEYAPDGYTMIDEVKKIEVLSGEQVHVYFEDETARMVIEKTDATDPQKMLEGARFKVTRDRDNAVIGEYVTDKSGMVTIDRLEPGLYHVEEIVAPDGYAIDEGPKLVHVKGGETAHASFADTPLAGITVNVVDEDDDPVVGAVIEVWRQNGELVNSYTTDTTGTIQSDKLDAGYYVIKLVTIPDGYNASVTEYTVEIKEGVPVTRTFELVSNGVLRVLSTDANDNAVAGMRFTVNAVDGAYVGEYTTSSNGSMTLPSLEPGWYVVTETKAPDGYTLSETKEQRVEVKAGADATVTFRHDQIYGLQISTICKQTNSAVTGAVYRVTGLDGAVVGTYTSGSGGLVFVPLTPGWYQVTPVSAPDGYSIPDSAPRTIQVLANGITKTEFVLEQMSSIRVKIVDGISGRGVYGVRLLVKDGPESIREYITDNEGYITLTDDVLNGNYTLEMISAPDGYTVDTVPKNIQALVGQTTSITWTIYQNAGQIQVVVTSSDYNKTRDLAAGSLLQGAVFQIMNADTYQVVGTMISDASGVAASSGLPIGRYIVTMTTAPAYYAVSDQQIEVRLKINNDVVRTAMQVKSVNLATEVEQKSNQTIRAGSNMRVDILKADNNSDVRLDNFNLHVKVPTDAARISTLYAGTWNQAVWYGISYKTNMNDYRQLASNLQSTSAYQYDLSSAALGLQSGEYVTDIRFEFGTVPAGFRMTSKSAMNLYVLSTVANGYKLISRAEVSGQYNTTTVSTTHIDNDWPYSTNGSYTGTGTTTGSTATGAGTATGTGSPAVSSNSGQWTSDTSLWTVTVTNTSNIPDTLPKTGY